MTISEKAKKYMIQTYAKYPIEIVKGNGSFVWDKNGKKYLDFYGGHAVSIVGHCPKKVISAIKKQSDELLFYSNIFYTKPTILLAEKLAKTLAPKKYQVYFTNSGSEANETAIKIARKYLNKKHVIAFKNSFHGRSITSLGVTGIDSYHQFSPNLDKHTSFAKLGDMESVKACLKKDTAAVICEPIQSIGGVQMAEKAFYQELEKFCKANGILLIFDEVQTGLGRIGTFWFAQKAGVNPDIITCAKGIASGLPIACVLVKDFVSKTIKTGEHATTFGGGPVVCCAALATLDIILEKGFLKSVKEKSGYLKSGLLKLPNVSDVFGAGFLLGVKFVKPVPDLVEKCLSEGVIIGNSGEKDVFRLLPPITVSKKEIDLFLDKFNKILT
ncbi:MAG: aminotransferase class III-fold pyridoxal phosphate-dependent enzyme [Patescibacteria group bacterium]